MARNVARAGLAAVLAVALVAPVATPALADDPAARRRRVEKQIAATKDDLAEATADVRNAADALASVAVRLPLAQTRLAEAEGRLAAANAAADAARAGLDAARTALAAAEADFATGQARVDETRRRAGALARAVYMTGPGGFAGTLVNAQSPADFVARVTYVHALLSDGTGRIREATDARVELASRAGVLTARRAALAASDRAAQDAVTRVEALVDVARAAQVDVETQVAARTDALAAARAARAADLARYHALVAESARLAELVRRASHGTGKVGRLLWPTPGPVTSGFGWRIHPIYGYLRFHPGIDIGAPLGQPIVAALGGVVVQAGPMGTYGNIVVIDHGNGFATAYAHQSRILVHVGEHVARGERIGLVGSTGASTGPHLHFETRVNGTPVNPLNYF